MSIDGVDFPINEPHPFNTCWYSHKSNGPAVRYETGVSIYKGHFVWLNGPFPAGSYPDVNIFRSSLKSKLDSEEFVITDRGYPDEKCLSRSFDLPDGKSAVIRSRHETLHSRLKSFSILRNIYRHDLDKHCFVTQAVSNLVQLTILFEHPLFYIDGLE